MSNFVYFLLIFWSLNSYAAHLPQIKAEKSIDFALDLEYLNAGNIQYFADTYSTNEFQNLPQNIRALDFSNFNSNDKHQFVFYKFAFILPINNNAIFDDNFYLNENFLKANNKGLIETTHIDQKNLLKLKLKLEGRKVGFLTTDPTIFYVQFSELGNKELSVPITNAVENLFEKNLRTPRTMFCKTTKSEQKIFVGGVTIASYYFLKENESLVIFYKLATLKPNLLIKSAIKVGLAPLFFEMEREDARKSVQKTRECVSVVGR